MIIPKIKVNQWRFIVKMIQDLRHLHVALFDAYVDQDIDLNFSLSSLLVPLFKTARYFHLVPLFNFFANDFLNNSLLLSNPTEEIPHHYDLRNPLAEGVKDPATFFRLWLDPSMTYSMGYWKNGTKSLEQAQKQKLELYQQWADIQQGHDVFEAGCGFGSFVPFVTQRGARYHGATLSEIHHRWVRLHFPNVQVRKHNFLKPWIQNNKQKKFDRIVSIAALEAVPDLDECFNVFRRMLKPDGKLFVHLITLNGSIPAMSDRYISSRIFPNGRIYNHKFLLQKAKTHFEVDKEAIFNGDHYARTLNEWLSRFERNIDKVKNLGASDKFIRFWRLYLSLCQALFEAKLFQNSAFVFKAKPTRKVTPPQNLSRLFL